MNHCAGAAVHSFRPVARSETPPPPPSLVTGCTVVERPGAPQPPPPWAEAADQPSLPSAKPPQVPLVSDAAVEPTQLAKAMDGPSLQSPPPRWPTPPLPSAQVPPGSAGEPLVGAASGALAAHPESSRVRSTDGAVSCAAATAHVTPSQTRVVWEFLFQGGGASSSREAEAWQAFDPNDSERVEDFWQRHQSSQNPQDVKQDVLGPSKCFMDAGSVAAFADKYAIPELKSLAIPALTKLHDIGVPEMMVANFTAAEFKRMGRTAATLKIANFTAVELRSRDAGSGASLWNLHEPFVMRHCDVPLSRRVENLGAE